MILDYDMEKAYAKSLEIEDIGNVSLRCTTKSFDAYYISTQTIAGKTYVLTLGPVNPDLTPGEPLMDGIGLSYTVMDFSDKALKKTLDKFVNNAKIGIDQVDEVDFTEVLEMIPLKESFIAVQEKKYGS